MGNLWKFTVAKSENNTLEGIGQRLVFRPLGHYELRAWGLLKLTLSLTELGAGPCQAAGETRRRRATLDLPDENTTFQVDSMGNKGPGEAVQTTAEVMPWLCPEGLSPCKRMIQEVMTSRAGAFSPI